MGRLWYQWPVVSKLGIISQIVEIERRLAATAFKQVKLRLCRSRYGPRGNTFNDNNAA